MSYVYLQHHGIKGQKWGVRRFQNADGSYTAAGKKRRNDDEVGQAKAAYKSAKKEYNKSFNKAYNRAGQAYSLSKKKRDENEKRWEDVADKSKALNSAKTAYKTAKTQSKATKNYEKFTKDDKKLFEERAKNRAKIEAKYDKKIEKAEQKNSDKAQKIKSIKATKLRDFDEGTKLIKQGQDAVNKRYSEYLDMTVKSVSNPSIRKTPEYKKAVKEAYDMLDHGKALYVLAEFMEIADKSKK